MRGILKNKRLQNKITLTPALSRREREFFGDLLRNQGTGPT